MGAPLAGWLMASLAHCATPGADKVCHAAVSGAATYVLLMGDKQPTVARGLLIGGFVFTAGVGKEVVDHINYGSTTEQWSGDLAADLAGIGFGLAITWAPRVKTRGRK